MFDFTRSHYLGFRHSTQSLRPWSRLTTGAPATLIEPAAAQAVAGRLARLQDCQQATLGRSTLHLFWDLFGLLTGQRVAIFLDSGAYPIAKWGVERAAAQGVPACRFPHKDAAALARLLRRYAGSQRRPIIVSDGLCAACGCALPLAAYLDLARRAGGLLVIDDTQALGLLGACPDAAAPYGRGGGGSLPYSGISGPEMVAISSLAKGFGAPLAALSGSEDLVRQFEARSESRVHCSPPSAADLHAADRALKLNAEQGDLRRGQLARRVEQFRKRLTAAGLTATDGLFPAQTLRLSPRLDARRLYRQLLDQGLRTILRRGHDSSPQISFIITARHWPNEIDQAVKSLVMAVRNELTSQPEDG